MIGWIVANLLVVVIFVVGWLMWRSLRKHMRW